MSQEIVAYKPTEAALADLESRYKGIVFDVKLPAQMVEAKKAYADINAHSITLEKARVSEKEESLKYGRFVDSEARRISAKLDALRLPIKDMIETETKREQREREAAIKAEQDRILAEQAAAKAAEEKRMAEQRAEIARQQAEIAAAQKAAADAERASREKIEAEQRAAREKIEAEERAARLQREEADRVARQAREAEEAKAKALRDAEEARLKAERDKIDAEARALAEAKRKEQDAIDAKAKAERDRLDAIERERLRVVAELADAQGMLSEFVRRFGKIEKYAKVVREIEAVL